MRRLPAALVLLLAGCDGGADSTAGPESPRTSRPVAARPDTGSPPPHVVPGQTWVYPVGVSDPDSADVHTYELIEGPPGTQLNGNTLTLVTDALLTGTHHLSVLVRDGSGAEALHPFLLSISELPTGPRYSIEKGGEVQEY